MKESHWILIQLSKKSSEKRCYFTLVRDRHSHLDKRGGEHLFIGAHAYCGVSMLQLSHPRIFLIFIQLYKISNSKEFLPCHEV